MDNTSRQEIIVETKGQLMAAILAFDVEIPTTIILKRKSGVTIIEHKYGECGETISRFGAVIRRGFDDLERIKRKIRSRIRRIPAKELLG